MNPNTHIFTVDYPGLARLLTTEVIVSPAFDPRLIPEGSIPHVAYAAIVDTGSTISAVSPRVVHALQLKPIRMVEVETISEHQELANLYLVNIVLRNKVGLRFLRCVEAKIRSGDVLIGMDVITRGDLVVTNFQGKTTFSFRMPSVERIDFGQVNK